MSHAIYDFLGYKIVEINYSNKNQKDNTYVSMSIIGEKYSEDKIYSFVVKIGTDYDNKEDSFVFEAAFKINDQEWFDKASDNEKKINFFSIVFPFIREKIFSITSDLNLGLFIPVLDVRNFDLSKEIRLIKSNN